MVAESTQESLANARQTCTSTTGFDMK